MTTPLVDDDMNGDDLISAPSEFITSVLHKLNAIYSWKDKHFRFIFKSTTNLAMPETAMPCSKILRRNALFCVQYYNEVASDTRLRNRRCMAAGKVSKEASRSTLLSDQQATSSACRYGRVPSLS